LWSSLTIHGSLATSAPDHSRRSFTAHYIPASQSYLWGRHARGDDERTVFVNGVEIILHDDKPRRWIQAKTRALPGLLRTHAPRLYQGLKAAKAGWQKRRR
jgi:hypothetical protein